MGSTRVQLQRERKKSLRSIQKARRSCETSLNAIEREIRRLLSRKRLIDYEDAERLWGMYEGMGDYWMDFGMGLQQFVDDTAING